MSQASRSMPISTSLGTGRRWCCLASSGAHSMVMCRAARATTLLGLVWRALDELCRAATVPCREATMLLGGVWRALGGAVQCGEGAVQGGDNAAGWRLACTRWRCVGR